METTPTMMMRHTGCMTMMIMMMTRFMQCEPDSASKASKHLHVLLDNLQLDPNARNPLFTEKCCHQGAPWRFTQCVSGFKDWNWSCSGTAAATATGLPRSVQRT